MSYPYSYAHTPDTRHVTPEQFAEIVRLMNERTALMDQSKMNGLTLSEKVDLQRRAKAIDGQIDAIR